MNHLLTGKTALNKFVHRLSGRDVTFHVHYWGVMPKHYNNQFHKHSFIELCYVVDGEGKYLEGNRAYSLHKNQLFLSRPNVLHQIKSDNGLFLLYVGLELVESESSSKWIKFIDQLNEMNEVVLDVEEDAGFSFLWESLFKQSSRDNHAFFEEIMMNTAYSLILSLLERFSPTLVNNENKKDSKEEISPILSQAKLYIRDNLSHTLRLSDIAKHLHISNRHLSRLFMKELGVSYSDYVKNKRIQKSANLLKTTNLSIKEISEQTGFINVHYFTRVFKATVGSSPGYFRTLYMDENKITYSEKKTSLHE